MWKQLQQTLNNKDEVEATLRKITLALIKEETKNCIEILNLLPNGSSMSSFIPTLNPDEKRVVYFYPCHKKYLVQKGDGCFEMHTGTCEYDFYCGKCKREKVYPLRITAV